MEVTSPSRLTFTSTFLFVLRLGLETQCSDPRHDDGDPQNLQPTETLLEQQVCHDRRDGREL